MVTSLTEISSGGALAFVLLVPITFAVREFFLSISSINEDVRSMLDCLFFSFEFTPMTGISYSFSSLGKTPGKR